MATQLAVLLRDGMHKNAGYTGAASTFYMLKVDQFQVNIAKTPIQIPIPQQSPELIDIGIFRPSITIGGLVDNVGQDITDTTDTYHASMESLAITATPSDSTTASSQTYYIPYKNRLEDAAYTWLAGAPKDLEIEIGDASVPLAFGANASTGGGIYRVAIQQARFQLDPAKEDRWTYTIQFVAKSRSGVDFTC